MPDNDSDTDVSEFIWLNTEELHLVKEGANTFAPLMAKSRPRRLSEMSRAEVTALLDRHDAAKKAAKKASASSPDAEIAALKSRLASLESQTGRGRAVKGNAFAALEKAIAAETDPREKRYLVRELVMAKMTANNRAQVGTHPDAAFIPHGPVALIAQTPAQVANARAAMGFRR